jgi:acetyltransferase-like isoleucine patch superfamily enzyme
MALLRPICRCIALVLATPWILLFLIGRMLGRPDRAVENLSQSLALLPGISGSLVRCAFYRVALAHCHPTAQISFGTLVSKTAARFGRHTYIGHYCHIGWVDIQDDVLIGPGVQIPSGPNTHGFSSLDRPIRDQPGKLQQIVIGRDSWIGAGTIILANVSEQSVVAAGSVVTKTFPPRSILGGIPAKVIGTRDGQLMTPNQTPTPPTAGE